MTWYQDVEHQAQHDVLSAEVVTSEADEDAILWHVKPLALVREWLIRYLLHVLNHQTKVPDNWNCG